MPPKPSLLSVLFNRRMWVVFLLGFSSGIPLLLIGSTLKAWMKESQIDLSIIGFFSLTGLPYTLKFLWAPLLDRYALTGHGRRRSWILITQLLLALSIASISVVSHPINPSVLAPLALLIAILSATQDCAIDAYRREILTSDELGWGSSLGVNGYRIALLVTGAGALWMADSMSWNQVYLIMGLMMGSGVLITLLCEEPAFDPNQKPKNFRESTALPLQDFLKRKGAWEILLFILLYKIGDSMASDMFTPFYLDIGFTKTEIAGVAKLFGFWSAIIGGLLGGFLMFKLGETRSLWIFGILQALSTAGFSILATIGPKLSWLAAVVAFENLSSGMGAAAYAAFMAALCNRRFTATQYAILSSLMGVPRVIFGSSSGVLAKNFGWNQYFLFCTLIAIPGLLMLLRKSKWQSTSLDTPPA